MMQADAFDSGTGYGLKVDEDSGKKYGGDKDSDEEVLRVHDYVKKGLV